MILININGGEHSKEYLDTFNVKNLEFALLHFNIKQDEIKLLIDEIVIEKNKMNLYRGGFLISSIKISDVVITKALSTIPLNKEVNGLALNELKYEYIISFRQFSKKHKINRMNNIYIIDRNPIDYLYTKK